MTSTVFVSGTTIASTWLNDVNTATYITIPAQSNASGVTYNPAGTGAVATTVQTKLRQTVSVKDFGAVGDGVANDTAAIQAAVDSVPYGGTVYIASGSYKLTDEIILHAGITVIGDGHADNVFGSPPAVASIPTMLCQTTAGKACLRIGGHMHAISIQNMVFSPSVSVTYPAVLTPDATGKIGILCESSTRVLPVIPADNGPVIGLELKNLMFYNLNYGIKVNDPNSTGDTGAGPYPYDWQINPALLSNLRFTFPKYGVYFNTSNADAWVFTGCAFYVPSGGDAVALYRWGMLHFINCFSGGNTVSGNRFLHIYNNGTTNGVEDIVLDSCQAESLTQFIAVDAGISPTYNFAIVCRDCVAELTSDIYLGSKCHLVSTRNRWECQIYIDNVSIKIDSLFDFFSGSFRFQFLKGSLSDCMQNFLPSSDATVYSNLYVLNGRITTYATTQPTSEVYAQNDRIMRTPPDPSLQNAWTCNVSGGAYSVTRANTTGYASGVWAIWTTGTTVWECTTAGTSAGAAPSIVGKVVGDTVTDGTVVWTMRSLTTASFIPEFSFGQTGVTSVLNSSATTLFTLPTTAALYEIYAYLAGGGSTYMRSARVGTDGTNVALIGGEGGAGMVASVSGLNVQVTQNSGVTQTVNWGYRRIT